MKTFIFLLSVLLLSCSGNHSHDGTYKATVFTDANMTWVRGEEIVLNGNEFYYKSISPDKDVQNEMKVTCVQYADRIEFKGKDGITMIARFDSEGNLRYGDYTYEIVRESNK